MEETIAVIDYDEVKSNHTYSEYTDAKNAYHAIQNMLIPFGKTPIDEAWIKKANGYIRYMQSEYRENSVYIGNLSEAVLLPAGSEGRSSTYEKLDQGSEHRGGDGERDF